MDGMWETIDIYCERLTEAFWAEPLNAVTNGAFIIAGVACLLLLRRRPEAERSMLVGVLAVLVILIGIGSFLFHTFATRWAAIADVAPIMLYMFSAVYFMTRRFFGAPIWASWAAVAGFIGLGFGFSQLGPYLPFGIGGSAGYLPALSVLLVVGPILLIQGHAAGASIVSAGLVFALSLTLRTVDEPYCAHFTHGDWHIGTHFMWHVLNGVTLYLVTRAAILHGDPGARRRSLAAAG